MRSVLDAGAFVAVERGDREVIALLKRDRLLGYVPVTHGGVVAQIWRGSGARQANVARLLDGVEVVALDDQLGRRAGMLLGKTRARDAVDAALVLLARDGDTILTSDVKDLRPLAAAAAVHVDLVAV
jgi:hypothetical protein